MRTAAPALLPIFRSRLQGELLSLILADPELAHTVEDLARRTGQPYQTVANEIRRLQAAELLRVQTVGRTKLLRGNQDSPYLQPLTQLVLMSFGPPLVVAEEFGEVGGIQQIFIFGSWAERYAGTQGPVPRDVDVLVIGAPNRDDLFAAAERAEQRLGREVNPVVRSAEQWRTADDGFTTQLRSSAILEIPLGPGTLAA